MQVSFMTKTTGIPSYIFPLTSAISHQPSAISPLPSSLLHLTSAISHQTSYIYVKQVPLPYVSDAPNLQLFHSVIIVLFVFTFFISHHTSDISVIQVLKSLMLFRETYSHFLYASPAKFKAFL